MAVTDNVMCKGQGQGFVVDTGLLVNRLNSGLLT